MLIFILNSGSSSIKFQLIDMPGADVVCTGLVERIGEAISKIIYTTNEETHTSEEPIADHKAGLERVTSFLMDEAIGVLKSTNDVHAVGHRVVHGGSTFSKTVIIDHGVKEKINQLAGLAPLHNPANLQGINVAEQIFSNARQVAVFDTAFHQSIPPEAYTYPIPLTFLTEHKIRLYGFHGTSHRYVSKQAIAYLGEKKADKIISIHLGNGCSMTAIKAGKSMDHSMGFAPLNGLMMGTRSGDIDPSMIFHLINTLEYSVEDVNTLLQKKSGMLGVAGHSDMRDIIAQAENGDKACQLALAMNTYRIKKYIGAYVSVLNGLDAIIFTAGIGENASVIRSMVCDEMDYFGILLNEEQNKVRRDGIREIQDALSKVKILVIPTNEELEIAVQTYSLIGEVY